MSTDSEEQWPDEINAFLRRYEEAALKDKPNLVEQFCRDYPQLEEKLKSILGVYHEMDPVLGRAEDAQAADSSALKWKSWKSFPIWWPRGECRTCTAPRSGWCAIARVV